MAFLPEESKYEDGIYQIEETDPVKGGPNGITNKPIRSLANRTRILKDWFDGHFGKGDKAHALASETSAGFISGGDKQKLDTVEIGAQKNKVLSVAGKEGNVVLTAADIDIRLATKEKDGLFSFVDKKKLDAIEEGAQKSKVFSVAGKDGAVTLTVADITGVAPLDSPALTGSPSAQSPPFEDSTGRLATTHWVRNAMLNVAQSAGFVFLPSTTGYVKFPSWLGGVVMQWGRMTITGGDSVTAFPISYQTAAFFVLPFSSPQSSSIVVVSDEVTNTSFRVRAFWAANGAFALANGAYFSIGK